MNYRNARLRDLCKGQACILELPCCTGGGDDTVPAHSNLGEHGKGMAIKAHDVFTFPACRACHHELDQGKALSRQQRQDLIRKAIDRWHLRMWQVGLVRVTA